MPTPPLNKAHLYPLALLPIIQMSWTSYIDYLTRSFNHPFPFALCRATTSVDHNGNQHYGHAS